MIGLDTNVLIRYITQDEASQSAKATRLIENSLSAKNPGFVTLITLVEVVWVLESCYQQSPSSSIDIVHKLLTTAQLVVERADVAYMALRRMAEYTSGVDFSDALISTVCEQAGCDITMTFDKKATKLGMKLLE